MAEARVTARDAGAIPENVYGSRKRIEWIRTHVGRSDVVLEVGCGTGYMICRPLARLGYHVHGIDIDAASVEHGQALLREEGLDPSILAARAAVRGRPRARRPDRVGGARAPARRELAGLLAEMRERLPPGGTLLVTVPNGYGWFELEQFLWWRAGLGRLLFRSGFCHFVEKNEVALARSRRGRRPARPRRCRARRTCSGSLSRGSHGGCRPPASMSSSGGARSSSRARSATFCSRASSPLLGGERPLGRSPGSDRLGLLPRLPAEALIFISWPFVAICTLRASRASPGSAALHESRVAPEPA